MSAGRGVKDIPAERLAALNAGAPATTLTECLAVDFAALMRAALPGTGEAALAEMAAAAPLGITRRMALAARLIRDACGDAGELRRHPSDSVRGWACFMIGADAAPLAGKLAAIRPLADDPHFGVREWAWLALRPDLAAGLPEAIAILSGWTASPSANLRRFASESIRPRGVWCAHIGALKRDPAQALPVLEPLRADPAAYVQDSVGNWLNDAAKDQPGWVRALCARWESESPCAGTARIRKRALRTIGPE